MPTPCNQILGSSWSGRGRGTRRDRNRRTAEKPLQIASCLELRKSRSAVFLVETNREIAEGCIIYLEQGSRRIRIHLEFGISCERGGFLPIVLEE